MRRIPNGDPNCVQEAVYKRNSQPGEQKEVFIGIDSLEKRQSCWMWYQVRRRQKAVLEIRKDTFRSCLERD